MRHAHTPSCAARKPSLTRMRDDHVMTMRKTLWIEDLAGLALRSAMLLALVGAPALF